MKFISQHSIKQIAAPQGILVAVDLYPPARRRLISTAADHSSTQLSISGNILGSWCSMDVSLGMHCPISKWADTTCVPSGYPKMVAAMHAQGKERQLHSPDMMKSWAAEYSE